MEKTFIINNSQGMHSQYAAAVVKQAEKYSSDLKISFDGKSADLKSILGVLSLGAWQGGKITITAEGDDAEAALKDLTNVIESWED